jgi:putative hydrolase of the HAD superfamily
MLENKKILIFDLGGVLIDLHVERSFAALVAMGADASILTERNCLINEYMMRYDRGDITTEEMFSYIASQLPAVECGTEQRNRIAEAWNMMLGEYAPYKFHRLRELRARGYRIVMLSNTNDGHWDAIERLFEATMGEPLQAFFDALYLSYRMHRRKPEPEIFLDLLASEGAGVADCIFFDDSAENCEAARSVGIEAVLMERNARWGGDLMND